MKFSQLKSNPFQNRGHQLSYEIGAIFFFGTKFSAIENTCSLDTEVGAIFFKVLNSLVRFSPLCFPLAASMLLFKITINNGVPSRNFRLILIHI